MGEGGGGGGSHGEGEGEGEVQVGAGEGRARLQLAPVPGRAARQGPPTARNPSPPTALRPGPPRPTPCIAPPPPAGPSPWSGPPAPRSPAPRMLPVSPLPPLPCPLTPPPFTPGSAQARRRWSHGPSSESVRCASLLAGAEKVRRANNLKPSRRFRWLQLRTHRCAPSHDGELYGAGSPEPAGTRPVHQRSVCSTGGAAGGEFLVYFRQSLLPCDELRYRLGYSLYFLMVAGGEEAPEPPIDPRREGKLSEVLLCVLSYSTCWWTGYAALFHQSIQLNIGLALQNVYGHIDDPEHQEIQRGVSYLRLRPGDAVACYCCRKRVFLDVRCRLHKWSMMCRSGCHARRYGTDGSAPVHFVWPSNNCCAFHHPL